MLLSETGYETNQDQLLLIFSPTTPLGRTPTKIQVQFFASWFLMNLLWQNQIKRDTPVMCVIEIRRILAILLIMENGFRI